MLYCVEYLTISEGQRGFASTFNKPDSSSLSIPRAASSDFSRGQSPHSSSGRIATPLFAAGSVGVRRVSLVG
jgi:hypothetical protein